MRYKPSTFYSNFSMAELVKRNSSSLSLDSSGGGGGGGGSSFGHSRRSQQAHYHKTDSFAFQLKSGGLGKIDEGKFLSSLKADLQEEIINTKAQINASGDLEVRGCYVEYREEGIQGRVEISGKVSGGSYYSLTASLSETSTSEKLPLIEGPEKRRQPTGTYHVVPFLLDDLRPPSKDLLVIGQRIIKESIENIRQQLLADQSRKDSLLQSLEYAEVYVWKPTPTRILERLKEAIGEEFEAPPEYEHYGIVYFLNDVALRMYREAGEDFEVLKTVSADEVSKILGPSLRGPYMAASKPER